MVTVIYAFTTW